MNRGSANGNGNRKRRLPRFNEAPIHESGKFESRVVFIPRLDASMRPRFMNRGSATLAAG